MCSKNLGNCVTCPTPTPATHRSKYFYGQMLNFCNKCYKAIEAMKRREVYSSPYPYGNRKTFDRDCAKHDVQAKLIKKMQGVDFRDLGTQRQNKNLRKSFVKGDF